MPPPVVVAPLVGPATVAAAKHAALTAASYMDAATLGSISSASIAAILFRLAWRRVPDWVKEDVSFQSLRSSSNNSESEARGATTTGYGEIERISSVMEKLQDLIVTSSKKLEDKEVPYLHAGIVAYIQLLAQFQKLYPQVRNKMYRQSGPDISWQQAMGLRESLDQATWAYFIDQEDLLTDYLEEADYALLHTDVATRPGTVGHYMAVSSKRKEILIGIKGTSSLEDIMTDCCGNAVPFHSNEHHNNNYEHSGGGDTCNIEVRATYENYVSVQQDDNEEIEMTSQKEMIFIHQSNDDEDDEHDIVTCHQGILIAAEKVANIVERTLRTILAGNEEYRLKIVGHSLGAGAAALLAVILRSRIPELLLNPQKKLSVVAFAPPPVLGHDAASAAASYCVSVVNNSDIIPRSSLANLAVFLEVLKTITNRLEELGMAPKGPRSTALFFQKLYQGTSGEPLLTLEQARDVLTAAHETVKLRDRDHLYVPGRVFLFHEPWGQKPNDEQTEQKDSNDHDDDTNNNNNDGMLPLNCTVTDGRTAVLRSLEIDGYRMLGDHVTASYEDAIDTLLSKFPTPIRSMSESSTK